MAERKKGRPSKYTKALGDEICTRLADGESLRSICRDERLPPESTVREWVRNEKLIDFSAQYAHAREEQAERIFEEMLEICDDGSNDWMERQRRDGTSETVLDQEHVQRSRLRIDTRKWVLAKMLPKKYGDLIAKDGEQKTQDLEPLQLVVKNAKP